MMKKIHVFISGIVQGVGFRYFLRTHAKNMRISGWARNTGNMVEALFHGSDDSIEKILELCRQGPPSSSVKEIRVEECPDEDCSDAFCIRF